MLPRRNPLTCPHPSPPSRTCNQHIKRLDIQTPRTRRRTHTHTKQSTSPPPPNLTSPSPLLPPHQLLNLLLQHTPHNPPVRPRSAVASHVLRQHSPVHLPHDALGGPLQLDPRHRPSCFLSLSFSFFSLPQRRPGLVED